MHTAQDSGLGLPTSATGRMFYTGLGHANETWLDPTFRDHIYGGLGFVLNIDTTK
jgi:type 1 glutamine amidotransferase